jgi:hypothetical protein
MDLIIGRMIEFGFTQSDLRQLENLSNPEILAQAGVTSFNRNVMSDTVKYMNAWADLLENQWMEQNINHIVLPTFEREEMVY